MPRRLPSCDPARVLALNDKAVANGPVVYWMSRDQRMSDNWALLHAQQLALDRGVPLIVVFALARGFLGATRRAYAFMFAGLKEVEADLRAKGIPFVLLRGNPPDVLAEFASGRRVGCVVTDFDPLRVKRAWKDRLARQLNVALQEVDAHNIVPCREASQKLEFAAHTLRPKIRRLLPHFLVPVGNPANHPHPPASAPGPVDWGAVERELACDDSVAPVDWLTPGSKAGLGRLRRFASKGIEAYESQRNDPLADAQSDLSPYLHFGQVAAQRVAYEVSHSGASRPCRDAFLEELIVRRELADNFCLYNPNYDNTGGFHAWAQTTLDAHRADPRETLYSVAELEAGATHDLLWNAAQREMVARGKMHGYLRMYWAKKILEWTESPAAALEAANYLNDRYELDGRDPNGYAGTAWSIGGVHDRAWGERPVFGKIRYMNYAGCRRKMDVDAYIRRHGGAACAPAARSSKG